MTIEGYVGATFFFGVIALIGVGVMSIDGDRINDGERRFRKRLAIFVLTCWAWPIYLVLIVGWTLMMLVWLALDQPKLRLPRWPRD